MGRLQEGQDLPGLCLPQGQRGRLGQAQWLPARHLAGAGASPPPFLSRRSAGARVHASPLCRRHLLGSNAPLEPRPPWRTGLPGAPSSCPLLFPQNGVLDTHRRPASSLLHSRRLCHRGHPCCVPQLGKDIGHPQGPPLASRWSCLRYLGVAQVSPGLHRSIQRVGRRRQSWEVGCLREGPSPRLGSGGLTGRDQDMDTHTQSPSSSHHWMPSVTWGPCPQDNWPSRTTAQMLAPSWQLALSGPALRTTENRSGVQHAGLGLRKLRGFLLSAAMGARPQRQQESRLVL